MEAAASGVPTVAYYVPGITASVVNGVTGTLVEDGDLTSLAKPIEDFLTDTSISTPSRCREHALNYSWESISKSWEKKLESLVAGNEPITRSSV